MVCEAEVALTHHANFNSMTMTKTTLLILTAFLQGAIAGETRTLVHLANPLQGTDSVRKFSHGNTYPAIALPFPMNVWAPYTKWRRNHISINTARTSSAASARRTNRARGSATTRVFP